MLSSAKGLLQNIGAGKVCDGAGLETISQEIKRDVSFVSSSMNGCYNQAVPVVPHDGKASTSYIQCCLSIEYNHVATLIERIEEEGIVSQSYG